MSIKPQNTQKRQNLKKTDERNKFFYRCIFNPLDLYKIFDYINDRGQGDLKFIKIYTQKKR